MSCSLLIVRANVDHLNESFIFNVTFLLSITLRARQNFKFCLSISLLVTALVLLYTVLTSQKCLVLE